MLKLIIEDDEGRKTVVPFERDEVTIGRQEGSTVRLNERNVSRKHARLIRKGSGLVLEDLGSANGIRLNGERLRSPSPVRQGDLIQIGDYDLALEQDGRGAQSPAPSSPTDARSSTLLESEPPPPPHEARDEVTRRTQVPPDRTAVPPLPLGPPVIRSRKHRRRAGISAAAILGLCALAALFIFRGPAPAPPSAPRPPPPEAKAEPSRIEPEPRPAVDPPDAIRVFELASTAIDTQSPERAIPALEKLQARADLSPQKRADVEVLLQRARTMQRPREVAVAKGRSKPVPAVPPQAAAPIPAPVAPVEDPARLFKSGTALFLKHNFEGAEQAYQRCLELSPNYARCHMMLGSTYAKLGQTDLGAQYYRSFIKLAPNDTETPTVRRLLDAYEASRASKPSPAESP